MNPKLTDLFTKVSNLDTYTQISILGSWGYTVNSSCINTAMRYVPAAPSEGGIEGLGQYEQARIALLKDADNSLLPGLLALQREISNLIAQADGQSRDLENTLDFMAGTEPKRTTFEREFEERRRLGMKPGLSKKQFVDAEYDRALARHDNLVANGEHAVRLCETVTIGHADSTDVPEWMLEAFEQKLIQKCHSRWEKIELTRTNPRMPKNIRDGAEADQLAIEMLLKEYNETPGFSGVDPDDPIEVHIGASTLASDPELPTEASDLSKIPRVLIKPNQPITAGS